MKFRFHVVGLPHTHITKEFMPCAYTQKVLNFCNMMRSLEHEVFVYGGPECSADCTEHVPLISHDEQEQFFGHVDWRKGFFPVVWDSNVPYWRLTNNRAIDRIQERKQSRDFLILSGGDCHKPIADAFSDLSVIEPFVGYPGIFAPFRVFESYAWMHYVYGLRNVPNGLSYDSVIANYFDPADFRLSASGVKKEDYCLFVGRMVSRKGIETAVEMTRRTGRKLIMAGQGVIEQRPGLVRSLEYTALGDHVEHIGTINAEQRNELMAKAHAVLVPTNYIGPFEGVHAEALLCGTPVITTDWGVFTETVKDGTDGYRCRTLGEFVKAIDRVSDLDPRLIRERAMSRFTTDTLKHNFNDFFTQVYTLWDSSWYDLGYTGSEKRDLGSFQD